MKIITNNLIEWWKVSFFTEPIVIITALICSIIITKQKKSNTQSLLLAYVLSVLFLFVGVDILYCLKIHASVRLKYWEALNCIFSFIQSVLFLSLFKRMIRTSWIIKAINICLIGLSIFLIYSIYMIWGYNREVQIFEFSGYASVLHYIIILLPIIYYFYEILLYNDCLIKHTAILLICIAAYCLFAMIGMAILYKFIDTVLYFIVTAGHYLSIILLCMIMVKYLKAEQKVYITNNPIIPSL